MATQTPCPGTLFRFVVPADARFPEAAIIACSDCTYITIPEGTLDERHRDAPVLTE